jgi:putative addiction module antidote
MPRGGAVTYKLKLRRIGNSTGVIMNRELLERLRVEEGDTIFAIETPGGVELTSYDPDVARQMESAEKVMRKHRDVLRKLAE